MVVYTLEQRWKKLRHYFENHGNGAECVQKFRRGFGIREAPSAGYVRYLVKKVKETGILADKLKREELKTVRTPENITAVAEMCVKHHQYQLTVVLNISETSVRRILHKDH